MRADDVDGSLALLRRTEQRPRRVRAESACFVSLDQTCSNGTVADLSARPSNPESRSCSGRRRAASRAASETVTSLVPSLAQVQNSNSSHRVTSKLTYLKSCFVMIVAAPRLMILSARSIKVTYSAVGLRAAGKGSRAAGCLSVGSSGLRQRRPARC